ncbi:MAG: methyltransferase domain-containing protein [Pirellulaceae bacterium]|nr:methyltransferase domain-containing protein [Pirellulaceae bacterium]
MTEEKEYVLGTGADELERLAFQHRLWSDAAHVAWKAARIQIGSRVLDVGCGPGFASFDLAQLVTRQGAVVGVDESPRFIEHLNQQAAARFLGQLKGVCSDVHELAGALEDEAPFDLAYARWVLCFVHDPEQVVRQVFEKLRPGGRFVIQDYFHYESMALAPKDPVHQRVVDATMTSWRAHGGNTDVVGELPSMLRRSGFRVLQITPHARTARPGETMFHWPELWWNNFAPKLVTMGYLSQSDCNQLLATFRDIRTSTDHFIQCPIVYEIIAEKLG